MKKLLLPIVISLVLTGCIAVPVYDNGYYPYYGPHPYGYMGPEVNFFFPGFHGHGFYGGEHGFHGGRR